MGCPVVETAGFFFISFEGSPVKSGGLKILAL
jgi:hypothetical protein